MLQYHHYRATCIVKALSFQHLPHPEHFPQVPDASLRAFASVLSADPRQARSIMQTTATMDGAGVELALSVIRSPQLTEIPLGISGFTFIALAPNSPANKKVEALPGKPPFLETITFRNQKVPSCSPCLILTGQSQGPGQPHRPKIVRTRPGESHVALLPAKAPSAVQ